MNGWGFQKQPFRTICSTGSGIAAAITTFELLAGKSGGSIVKVVMPYATCFGGSPMRSSAEESPISGVLETCLRAKVFLEI